MAALAHRLPLSRLKSSKDLFRNGRNTPYFPILMGWTEIHSLRWVLRRCFWEYIDIIHNLDPHHPPAGQTHKMRLGKCSVQILRLSLSHLTSLFIAVRVGYKLKDMIQAISFSRITRARMLGYYV